MQRIQWGPDARQRVSYVAADRSVKHWLVVVHGGAWRDPRITDMSAGRLVARAQKWGKFGGVASCDYRLSPEVRDPAHVDDCLHGIAVLQAQFGFERITLVGHSCGAFMAGQIAERLPQLVASVVGVEGIYDLYELVREYPDYAGFVSDAFADWPRIAWDSLPIHYVVQSKDDELLSMHQSGLVRKAKLVAAHGKHDEVFEQNVDWIDSVI